MNHSVDTTFMPAQTRDIFNILSGQEFISKYVLVGGTALSIQIRHRFSEDLDFIFDGENLNITSIRKNLAKSLPGYRIIRIEKNEQIDVVIQDVKLTFFCSGMIGLPFKVSDYSFTYSGINIATIEILAVLKMNAIAQRNTIRDYYDLYWLTKNELGMQRVISSTKELLPGLSPVTYTETLVYTDDIEESDISAHLNPRAHVTKQQIADYFITELRKIVDKI